MTEPTHLAVRGWRDFQHYRDRRPPWIKLYVKLLEDYDFGQLSDADKGHLMMIWLLASRHDGVLPNDAAWIARQANLKTKPAIARLTKLGWLEYTTPEQVASKPLAIRKRPATPETETETETETEATAATAARAELATDDGVVGWPQWVDQVPESYRPAVFGAVRAARNPDALRRELLNLTTPMTGGVAYPPAVVGQALHELAVAGSQITARGIKGFCRRIAEGEPPPRTTRGGTEIDWDAELTKLAEAATRQEAA